MFVVVRMNVDSGRRSRRVNARLKVGRTSRQPATRDAFVEVRECNETCKMCEVDQNRY